MIPVQPVWKAVWNSRADLSITRIIRNRLLTTPKEESFRARFTKENKMLWSSPREGSLYNQEIYPAL